MWVPLVGLAIGAIVIGYLMLPMVATDIDFWGTSILVLPIHNALEEAHHVDFWVKALPMAVGVLGIGSAFLFYVLKPELPGLLATRARPVYLFLLNKWYFDDALRFPLRNGMTDWPILSTVTFLPLVGVFFILLVRGDERQIAANSRHVALWTSVVTFALSILLVADFDTSTAEFQFVELVPWLPEHNIGYHLGVDGISIFFLILTTFLIPICILASWEAIATSRARVHDRIPGHGDADRRCLLLPRLGDSPIWGSSSIGIFTFTGQGIEGGIIQMLSHGIVSAALFLCVGVVYDRTHTPRRSRLWRLVHRIADLRLRAHGVHAGRDRLAWTSGFVGEFMVLGGRLPVRTPGYAMLALTAVAWFLPPLHARALPAQ
ncbi:NADH-quinone oxidoreductase subunit M [Geodia barretti]|uniref:NADH-ubiquinone oxidoreductase chain 4 n=1 Tax=Geodia barretti TaxID=519541 RepID=A0AA35WX59_GEOBA|nr:NADH-quinone oxidoreductase subunit M [Geodia barretti]